MKKMYVSLILSFCTASLIAMESTSPNVSSDDFFSDNEEHDWAQHIPDEWMTDSTPQQPFAEASIQTKDRKTRPTEAPETLEQIDLDNNSANEETHYQKQLTEIYNLKFPDWSPMHYWAAFFIQLDGSKKAIESLRNELHKNPKEMHAALMQADDEGALPIYYAINAAVEIEHNYAFNDGNPKTSYEGLCLYRDFIKELLSTPELRTTLECKSNGFTPIEIAKKFYDMWNNTTILLKEGVECTQPMLIYNKDNTLRNIALLNPPIKKCFRMPWIYQYLTAIWPKEWNAQDASKQELNAPSQERSAAHNQIYKLITGKEYSPKSQSMDIQNA